MALEKWIKIKLLENPTAINALEEKYKFFLSDELRNCILSNNGARPRPNVIRLQNGEENDVKTFLSYNRGDTENIYKVIDYFIKEYNGTLIPFAIDSAGNYYCEKGKNIVLWTQNKEILYVCDNILQFLELLYELE